MNGSSIKHGFLTKVIFILVQAAKLSVILLIVVLPNVTKTEPIQNFFTEFLKFLLRAAKLSVILPSIIFLNIECLSRDILNGSSFKHGFLTKVIFILVQAAKLSVILLIVILPNVTKTEPIQNFFYKIYEVFCLSSSVECHFTKCHSSKHRSACHEIF